MPPVSAMPEFLFELPQLHYPELLNAGAELTARAPSTALAIVNDAGSWTYGELNQLSDRIARILVEEEGLVPGNRVFLRGPNCAMLFASWLAVLRAGGIVVTTMPILRAGEIAAILERARISHAIVDSRFAADFESAVAQASPVRSVLRYCGDEGSGELEVRFFFFMLGF